MSINSGVDKDGAGHVYTGMLLIHIKEHNSTICRVVDGPYRVRQVKKRKTSII